MTIIHLLRYGADVNKTSPYFEPNILSDQPVDELKHELPIDVALGHRMLAVVQMLWEAGSLAPKNVVWFRHSLSEINFLPKRSEVDKYLRKMRNQPRSLLHWSRQVVRKAIPNITPQKVQLLEIPENLKEYVDYSDLEEIYENYCPEYIKGLKRYEQNDDELMTDEDNTSGLVPSWNENSDDCQQTNLVKSLCDPRDALKYNRPKKPQDMKWKRKYVGDCIVKPFGLLDVGRFFSAVLRLGEEFRSDEL